MDEVGIAVHYTSGVPKMTVTTGFEGDAVLVSSPSLTYYTFEKIEIYSIIFYSVPPRDIGKGGWEDLETGQ